MSKTTSTTKTTKPAATIAEAVAKAPKATKATPKAPKATSASPAVTAISLADLDAITAAMPKAKRGKPAFDWAAFGASLSSERPVAYRGVMTAGSAASVKSTLAKALKENGIGYSRIVVVPVDENGAPVAAVTGKAAVYVVG